MKSKLKFNIIILCVFALILMSTGVTFALFTARTEAFVDDAEFGLLDTEISLNSSSFSTDASISVTDLACGSAVIDTAKVRLGGNIEGYIRVKVDFCGKEDNMTSIAVATALNMDEGNTGYDTFSSELVDYGWQYLNGYYYLIDKTNNKLLTTSSEDVDGFVLFQESMHGTVYLPDLSKYNIENASLEDVSLVIEAQAMQKSHTDTNTPSGLASVIASYGVFAESANNYHLLQFNTLGGVKIYSRLISTSVGNEVLPTVSGVDVGWYLSYENGVYSSLAGTSGDNYARSAITQNTVLYAKYEYNEIVVMFDGVLFTDGTLPSVRYISYDENGGTEDIYVGDKLTRVGYDYDNWMVDSSMLSEQNLGKTESWINSHLHYTLDNGYIHLLADIVSPCMAITLYPDWELVNYVATFNLNDGDDLTSADKALEDENNAKLYQWDSTNEVFHYNYNIETEFRFPQAVKAGKVFKGWEILTREFSDSKWRQEDCYVQGDLATGYYGEVVFVAQWGES